MNSTSPTSSRPTSSREATSRSYNYVRLVRCCSNASLPKSRTQHGKIADPETLDRLLDAYDCFTAMPDRDSLTIDLGATSARDAADLIIDHITGD